MTQELIHSGKVRDTFDGGADRLVVVATDRLSAFDVVSDQPMPGKGEVLTALTKYWLRSTPVGHVMPHHLADDGLLPAWADPARSMVVRHAQMVPVECIVRGFLLGSAWAEYQRSGTMHGKALPPGMVQAQRLPEPTFTPSTKAPDGEHDVNLSFDEMISLLSSKMMLGYESAKRIAVLMRDLSTEIYETGSTYAAERGLLIFDTKLELGYVDGRLTLCDEVLTPDSSRFALAESFTEGEPPKSLDKEIIRDWLKQNHPQWVADATPPMPTLPGSVIEQTMVKYRLMLDLLTGPPLAA